jgi:hypothetical protein
MMYWADQGFEWYRPYAPLKNLIAPVTQEMIMQLACYLMNPGVKKMHATLLLPESDYLNPVSIMDIEKSFAKCNLWTGKRKPKVKFPIRCRYEADYNTMIWHADLHYFHHGGWIIAWIDDRSRMCLSFKFLSNQSSAEAANAFCEIPSEYLILCSIWTDNGKEFKGSSQKV